MAEPSMGGGYRGRFAPSPTGPLHFGSLVAALASYLDARAAGGRWLLRIEDVDTTRCRPEFTRDIIDTLAAFGFEWDGDVIVQSTRTRRYADAAGALRQRALTYACGCSRREIADSAMAGIDGPVYPGTCRDRQLPEAGHAVRLRAGTAAISFIDRVQGAQCQQLAADVGDFILKRRDGLYAYQLAVVVDDADAGITDVVRGADLLDSTARQIRLQQCLELPTPRYLHVPVAVNAAGQKLSKQTLAPAINAGEACAVIRSALAFLGQAMPDAETPRELLALAAGSWEAGRIPRVRSLAARANPGSRGNV